MLKADERSIQSIRTKACGFSRCFRTARTSVKTASRSECRPTARGHLGVSRGREGEGGSKREREITEREITERETAREEEAGKGRQGDREVRDSEEDRYAGIRCKYGEMEAGTGR